MDEVKDKKGSKDEGSIEGLYWAVLVSEDHNVEEWF
jgi:hypothetical protein